MEILGVVIVVIFLVVVPGRALSKVWREYGEGTNIEPYKDIIRDIAYRISWHFSTCRNAVHTLEELDLLRFDNDDARSRYIIKMVAEERQRLPYTSNPYHESFLTSLYDNQYTPEDMLLSIVMQEWDRRVSGCPVSDYIIRERFRIAISTDLNL